MDICCWALKECVMDKMLFMQFLSRKWELTHKTWIWLGFIDIGITFCGYMLLRRMGYNTRATRTAKAIINLYSTIEFFGFYET